MTAANKLGIWMDHACAHVMGYGDPVKTDIIISGSTHEEKEKRFRKGKN